MNIWQIRNRAARAAVSWLLAALAAIVVLVASPVFLICLAGAGVRSGLAGVWRDHEWRSLAAYWWAAATGREVA